MMDLMSVNFFLLLLTCAGQSLGQQLLLPAMLNGIVADKVTFTPKNIPAPPYNTIIWDINGSTIVSVGGTTVITPDYINRTSFDMSTLSLELRNLTKNDSGTYKLTVTKTASVSASTSLQVFDKISNVTITANDTELVEFNSSVSLNCSASGSSPSFLWFNGSSEIKPGGRVQLTDNNRTLIISSVRREETGPYTCEVSNPVSNGSSSLNLTIYYGPENVTLTAEPMIPVYISGSNLKLTCSAVSKPDAEFYWALNGTELNKTSKELKLENIQSNQKGNYTCRAHNIKTLINAISEPLNIPVLEKVSGAKITVSPNDLGNVIPSSINMTCNGGGDISNTEWMKNDSKLSAGGNISFSADNRILMINPVSKTDAGVYQCNLSNSFSFNTAEYKLTFDRGGAAGGGALSGGAIAGIVIGVIVGVLLITALIFYIVKYKKIQIGFSASKSGGAQNNSEQELQYADIRHNQNRPVSNMAIHNQDGTSGSNSVIYSDVNLSGNKAVN